MSSNGNDEQTNQPGHMSSEDRSKSEWFATFTVLDISGAIGSSQLKSALARLKALFTRKRHRLRAL